MYTGDVVDVIGTVSILSAHGRALKQRANVWKTVYDKGFNTFGSR